MRKRKNKRKSFKVNARDLFDVYVCGHGVGAGKNV